MINKQINFNNTSKREQYKKKQKILCDNTIDMLKMTFLYIHAYKQIHIRPYIHICIYTHIDIYIFTHLYV
jgi:hypothetical protein